VGGVREAHRRNLSYLSIRTAGHPHPGTGHTEEEAAGYKAAGFWGTESLADWVRRWGTARPDAVAFSGDDTTITFAEYDRFSDDVALALIEAGLQPGDRMATLFPDGPEVHVAWLAAEKAGLVVVGIGARAGDREIHHLLGKSGASAVLSTELLGPRPVAGILAGAGHPVQHIVLDDLSRPVSRTARVRVSRTAGQASLLDIEQRRLGPDDVFMLNSTSGTTGMPKCVMHNQNRWFYFHQLAVEAGGLHSGDVFCSALPSPFGFGLWTAHFTPTFLGAPAHVRRRFDPEEFAHLIGTAGVTVLAAVTTQLIMLLNSPNLGELGRGCLRVVFTGGEAVPYDKAAEFEDRTGARVLQFYGSNETGAVSRTTLSDDRRRRLTTAGRVIPEMNVRLVDPESGDRVTGQAGAAQAGRPACRGPATCEGYWNDPDGNAQLYTGDGWMLMGDLVSIDADGYLTVIGRTSDIIIRGGKNIGAAAVEAEVMTHPLVVMAAAVAVPDAVLGERVCVFVETRGGTALTLEQLSEHLQGRGVTREWFPEYLVVVDELPRSSGGKVAKADLRAEARRRLTR
jgi:acyl-CoA synthetase